MRIGTQKVIPEHDSTDLKYADGFDEIQIILSNLLTTAVRTRIDINKIYKYNKTKVYIRIRS